MKFSVRPIVDVSSVNDFRYKTELQSIFGDPVDLYFQLFDEDKNLSTKSYESPGLRYIPQALSTLQVTFRNLDDTKNVVRYASQPFAQDLSIWKISVLATDPIRGTVNCKFVLTEPGPPIVTRTFATQAIFLCSETQ
jgi:hypothetical protein